MFVVLLFFVYYAKFSLFNLLLVFTIAEGYLLGAVAATYSAQEVAIAVAFTIIIVIALTLFAFQVSETSAKYFFIYYDSRVGEFLSVLAMYF